MNLIYWVNWTYLYVRVTLNGWSIPSIEKCRLNKTSPCGYSTWLIISRCANTHSRPAWPHDYPYDQNKIDNTGCENITCKHAVFQGFDDSSWGRSETIRLKYNTGAIADSNLGGQLKNWTPVPTENMGSEISPLSLQEAECDAMSPR